MKRIKIGILTMSDGREYLHEEYEEMNLRYQRDIAAALEATGDFEVVQGQCAIHTNAEARAEGQRLRDANVEATIFNFAIWCYPQFTAVAQNFAPGPYLLFSNLHPSECGMVGMLAAAGTLDQLGVKYTRLWGTVSDPAVFQRMTAFLRGLTFGNFGGRPLGMYTAVANLEQWQREFGIDVENVEQDDIIRTGEEEPAERVEAAFRWLEAHVGEIAYDGEGLTPDKLKLQIRSYYGLRRIIERRGLDFIGIKAHGDLTDRYITMDVAEAFLNDPYDWDGPHEPIVAATESDMDGALTMQIFKLLTGFPVLFADVRHYDKENNVWFFSNSGTHATYFAGGSLDPEENLKHVTFYPETHYYPAGGAQRPSLRQGRAGDPGPSRPQGREIPDDHRAGGIRGFSAGEGPGPRRDDHAGLALRLCPAGGFRRRIPEPFPLQPYPRRIWRLRGGAENRGPSAGYGRGRICVIK